MNSSFSSAVGRAGGSSISSQAFSAVFNMTVCYIKVCSNSISFKIHFFFLKKGQNHLSVFLQWHRWLPWKMFAILQCSLQITRVHIFLPFLEFEQLWHNNEQLMCKFQKLTFWKEVYLIHMLWYNNYDIVLCKILKNTGVQVQAFKFIRLVCHLFLPLLLCK